MATFFSIWMLNKYSSRAKLHLISWIEGKDKSRLRGVGLFKELDMQARGKLLAAKIWSRCRNKSRIIFTNLLGKSNWIRHGKKNDDTVPVVSLAWWPCSCNNDVKKIRTLKSVAYNHQPYGCIIQEKKKNDPCSKLLEDKLIIM